MIAEFLQDWKNLLVTRANDIQQQFEQVVFQIMQPQILITYRFFYRFYDFRPQRSNVRSKGIRINSIKLARQRLQVTTVAYHNFVRPRHQREKFYSYLNIHNNNCTFLYIFFRPAKRSILKIIGTNWIKVLSPKNKRKNILIIARRNLFTFKFCKSAWIGTKNWHLENLLRLIRTWETIHVWFGLFIN